MTATDIFIGVIIIGTVIAGLITVFLGYADYYVIGVIQNFNKGLPPSVNPGAATTSLLNFSSSFATFFPDLSVVLAIILMAGLLALQMGMLEASEAVLALVHSAAVLLEWGLISSSLCWLQVRYSMMV